MTAAQTQNVLKGSLGIGVGTGLLAALYDAVRSERRRVQAEQGKGEKTLELLLPAQIKESVFREAVAGVGVAAGSYYLVQQLYKKWKKEQLARETQDATQDYLGTVLGSSLDKQAFLGTVVQDIPSDLLTLLPLAAAGGTYGLLEHVFPKVKEKKRPGTPRKIVIKGYGAVAIDGPGDGPFGEADAQSAEQQQRKAATYAECPYGPTDVRNAAESLCLMLTALPTVKEASSPLSELLGAFILDPRGLESLVKSAGVLAAISASKGGSAVYYTAGDVERRHAVRCAFKSASLAPSLALLTLGEFNDYNPTHAKLAQAMAAGETNRILLTKMASVVHVIDTCGVLQASPQVKHAAALTDGMLKDMGTLDASEAKNVNGDVNAGDRAFRGKTDPIDDFLAGKR